MGITPKALKAIQYDLTNAKAALEKIYRSLEDYISEMYWGDDNRILKLPAEDLSYDSEALGKIAAAQELLLNLDKRK